MSAVAEPSDAIWLIKSKLTGLYYRGLGRFDTRAAALIFQDKASALDMAGRVEKQGYIVEIVKE